MPDETAPVAGDVVAVPVMSVRPGESPRLNGEDRAHIARLAETEAQLPPILVERRTMQVIDGMHRLMAASLQGRETIDVVFFDGSEEDKFLRAVQENVAHGLPLTHADRRAAAERIVVSHPQMSDRTIGQWVGLSAKTVAAIRRRSADGGSPVQAQARVGRDGRVRPLDISERRRRAAELLAEQPMASLRDVARATGISPATVQDVRRRLERGESPAPEKPAAGHDATAAPKPDFGPGAGSVRQFPVRGAAPLTAGPRPRSADREVTDVSPAIAVQKLLRDPSLRGNELCREMLRLLHITAVGSGQLKHTAATVPPHSVAIVGELARQYSKVWMDFARELDRRARIIDPSSAAIRKLGLAVAVRRGRRSSAESHRANQVPATVNCGVAPPGLAM
jgi:ParB-like chromosome segregation protein Spo0J